MVRSSNALCGGCYKVIDLTWFSTKRLANEIPIVHECGRVLYSGKYREKGEDEWKKLGLLYLVL